MCMDDFSVLLLAIDIPWLKFRTRFNYRPSRFGIVLVKLENDNDVGKYFIWMLVYVQRRG